MSTGSDEKDESPFGPIEISSVGDDVELISSPEVAVEPNWWWKYRQILREPVAEFTGVMVLVIFGTGVNCQVGLSANASVAPSPKGDYLSVCLGWSAAVALGAWVSAGISGAHINPAVTLALATWRRFPWKKVPVGYLLAQFLGGIVGGAIVYANYFHAIDIVEGERGLRTLATAGVLGTYPLEYMTNVSCFFSEFLGTAMLVLVVLATIDPGNTPPPSGVFPIVLFIALLGISASLGMETSFALNPARDLGPRIVTSMVGYGRQVYTFRNQYWIWCPFMGPILGAQVATMFYDVFLFQGSESIVNKRSGSSKKRPEDMA